MATLIRNFATASFSTSSFSALFSHGARLSAKVRKRRRRPRTSVVAHLDDAARPASRKIQFTVSDRHPMVGGQSFIYADYYFVAHRMQRFIPVPALVSPSPGGIVAMARRHHQFRPLEQGHYVVPPAAESY